MDVPGAFENPAEASDRDEAAGPGGRPRLDAVTRLLSTVVLGLLSVLLLLPGAPASAHDELRASDPRDGSTLEQAPERISLSFSGTISDLGAQVAVSGPEGDNLTEGEARVEGTEVEQELAELGPGAHTVLWRVTSSDGHPISGEFSFTVAAGQDDATGGDATEPNATETDGTDAAVPTTDAAAAPEAASTVDTTTEDLEAQSEETTGLPVWVWIALGVAVAGLAALLARTWSRGRR